MKSLRQVSPGILASLISLVIVFGSLMLSYLEGGSSFFTSVYEAPVTGGPRSPTWTPKPGSPVAIVSTETPQPTALPTLTSTSICKPPRGWTTIYTVQPGDTLEYLAEIFSTSVKKLVEANCLPSDDLYPEMELFVPQIAPTATEYVCGQPFGWVFYTVQADDTLYSIARKFNTTVLALQLANCLGSSTIIRIGQQIYVPYVATSTPWILPTSTLTLQPTQTPTLLASATAVPTILPTHTLTPLPFTPTLLPNSPTPTLETVTPTSTPSLEATSTAVPTLVDTWTATPTIVLTDTPTPLPTESATPTATFTELPTVTIEPTATLTQITNP